MTLVSRGRFSEMNVITSLDRLSTSLDLTFLSFCLLCYGTCEEIPVIFRRFDAR
jgi:hypothetical protein